MSPHPEHLREMRLSALPAAPTCESCRHWGDSEDARYDRRTRNCRRIRGVTPDTIGAAAVIVRSSAYDPRLNAAAGFGCNLHDPGDDR